MCMYVYMNVFMCVCMCIYVNMCIYIHMWMYSIYACVYEYVFRRIAHVCICMCKCVYVCIHTNTYICIIMCMWVLYRCMCMSTRGICTNVWNYSCSISISLCSVSTLLITHPTRTTPIFLACTHSCLSLFSSLLLLWSNSTLSSACQEAI